MKYNFHRDFYNLMLDSIDNNSVTFLLGTRKCGKTVCLKQLEEALSDAIYVDFKQLNNAESYKIIDDIIESIANDKNIIYLLDEITSVNRFDDIICRIAESYTDLKNLNTKIVFSGSQSVALELCSDRAFAGNANIISVDFLSYSEFLRFKNIKEISEESYSRFIMEASDFYDNFTSLKEYLKGCINETVISNMKASEVMLGNETSLIKDDADYLVNLCYQTLFSLHKQIGEMRFFMGNRLIDDIPHYFRDVCKELGDDIISEKICSSFVGSYNSIKSRDAEMLRQSLMFLEKCNLITISSVANNLDDIPDIRRNILTGNNTSNLRADLFNKFNVCIKYPMFYVQILKDILGKDMPTKLPNELLGSIVECHARALLSNGFELKTNELTEDGKYVQHEIDFIEIEKSTATEFTISNKHKNHFNILPDYFKKVKLSRDISSNDNGIIKVPYYEYLYNLSKEKYLSKNITNKSLQFTKDSLKHDLAEKKAAEKDAPFKPGHEKNQNQSL